MIRALAILCFLASCGCAQSRSGIAEARSRWPTIRAIIEGGPSKAPPGLVPSMNEAVAYPSTNLRLALQYDWPTPVLVCQQNIRAMDTPSAKAGEAEQALVELDYALRRSVERK